MKHPALLAILFTFLLVRHSHAQGAGSITLWGAGNYPGGAYSAVGGWYNSTTGAYSISLGQSNYAGGQASFAAGVGSTAAGLYSIAMGAGAYAAALNSASFGSYPVFRGNPTTWVATDPVLAVGNGQSGTTRSNALVVLKNGAVLIKPADDISMGSYTAGIKPDDTTVP